MAIPPGRVKSPELKKLERHLLRTLQRTCERYQLLSPGDRVAVAVSGGKDSSGLLLLLRQLLRALPFAVELRAVHLDQHQPGYDNDAFVSWLREESLPFDVVSEDTYSVVRDHVPEGNTFCSLCSRLRRGVLYTALDRMGFDKLALGHHRDDALETFLMNAFFSGKLQAMPAQYQTNCGRFSVIRPLIEVGEDLLLRYSELYEFPILPCNLCGSQDNLQRKRMKELLSSLEADHPNVRAVMLNALGNVRPSHLLDEEVAQAWQSRPTELRPDNPERSNGAKRMLAVVSQSSDGRLPILQDEHQVEGGEPDPFG